MAFYKNNQVYPTKIVVGFNGTNIDYSINIPKSFIRYRDENGKISHEKALINWSRKRFKEYPNHVRKGFKINLDSEYNNGDNCYIYVIDPNKFGHWIKIENFLYLLKNGVKLLDTDNPQIKELEGNFAYTFNGGTLVLELQKFLIDCEKIESKEEISFSRTSKYFVNGTVNGYKELIYVGKHPWLEYEYPRHSNYMMFVNFNKSPEKHVFYDNINHIFIVPKDESKLKLLNETINKETSFSLEIEYKNSFLYILKENTIKSLTNFKYEIVSDNIKESEFNNEYIEIINEYNYRLIFNYYKKFPNGSMQYKKVLWTVRNNHVEEITSYKEVYIDSKNYHIKELKHINDSIDNARFYKIYSLNNTYFSYGNYKFNLKDILYGDQ